MYPPANGGGVDATLPEGFENRVNAGTGALELWKTDVSPEVLITSADAGEFTVNGSLTAAINTIYLEKAHSISSSGEEVTFQNLETSVFYTPVWQYTSENGESVGEASVLVESAEPSFYYDNGEIVSADTSVPCTLLYSSPSNATIYAFRTVAAEAYEGEVSVELINAEGNAVFRRKKTVSLADGDDLIVDKFLYRVRTGSLRILQITKADGEPLTVRSGIDPEEPFTELTVRGFVDRKIVAVDGSGRIPASLLPETDNVEVKAVANEAARLALPVSDKFRIVIEVDTSGKYYLGQGLDPSVSGNWVYGGSTSVDEVSFNGRVGSVIVPQAGDYTAAQVGAVAVPVNDGVRRVLIGNTAVVETISDNLTTDSALSVLSARQGKALKDSLEALPSNAAPAALATSAAIGTSARLARQDHVHQLPPVASTSADGLMSAADKAKLDAASGYTKCGFDFTVSTNPTRVYRDLIWCSSQSGATVQAANVPWVVADQADADRLAAYWIQQLTTFFKNLENDSTYDQLIGAIPSASGIASKLASGTVAVAPSPSTDMDNNFAFGTGINYGSEWFELVVGANAAGTQLYTMWFTFALVGSSATSADSLFPFRMVFQTTANQTLTSFPTTSIGSLSGAAPRTSARTTAYTPPGGAFLLCAEPVSVECRR